jgi:exosortase/archaeosortase family protein
MKNFLNKQVLIYLIKFIGAFCFLYYGTLAIIGLSSPGGYYSEFVARYLNFIPAFRNSLLICSEYFLALLGYESYQAKGIQLLLVGGGGVSIVYSCLGYGITSFWLAFVFANYGSWKKKLLWMVGGATALYIINVLRMSLVALASHKRWAYPFGWDHHTWFNIVAYGMIFLMMWVYDKSQKPKVKSKKATEQGPPLM